ncbi:MAG: CoA protein activase [Dehalococcoidia bacterium]|nr:CoA protein activase [Dehalococcoidia bacterium]
MKITIPHIGNMYVAFRAMFEGVGVEMIVPPPTSKRTLTLGVQHSPEFVCLPFKLTLGNFIEALDLGAELLIQAGGPGLCRYGYYARDQAKILQDLGYNFEMVTTELFESKIVGVANLARRLSDNAPFIRIASAIRFGMSKISAMDNLERVVHQVRARELQKGASTRIFRDAVESIDRAQDRRQVKAVAKEYAERLRALPIDPKFEPLVVGMMGEFFIVLDPFSNMDVEIELGRLGVEVRRSAFVSSWLKFSLFLNAIGISEKDRIHQAALPYLKRDVGGDGWESVGEPILHRHEYDGMVHLAPFTCMPEIIAQNIMPTIKDRLPVLTITCDEQMGRAGMITRLEAFVDMLRKREESRGKRPGAERRALAWG